MCGWNWSILWEETRGWRKEGPWASPRLQQLPSRWWQFLNVRRRPAKGCKGRNDLARTVF